MSLMDTSNLPPTSSPPARPHSRLLLSVSVFNPSTAPDVAVLRHRVMTSKKRKK